MLIDFYDLIGELEKRIGNGAQVSLERSKYILVPHLVVKVIWIERQLKYRSIIPLPFHRPLHSEEQAALLDRLIIECLDAYLDPPKPV